MTNVPTWLAALGIVLPVLAGLGGYFLAGLNEEKRDIRTADRERAARRATVVQQADDRRHEFQREVLLELQDVLRRFMRTAYKVVRNDVTNLREHGTVGLLNEELNQEAYDAGVDLGRMRQRVLDDRLRTELGLFHDQCTTLELAFTSVNDRLPEEAIAELEFQHNETMNYGAEVIARLGGLLRYELGRVPRLESPLSLPEQDTE
jgi:hypothetical protein